MATNDNVPAKALPDDEPTAKIGDRGIVQAQLHNRRPRYVPEYEARLLAHRKPMRKQRLANRSNALSGGVKTQAGKDVSRLNARKSGIFAQVLTAADREELAPVLESFGADLRPAGALENALVEKLALTYLRLRRCALAEAAYHEATWAPYPKGKDARPLGTSSDLRPWHFEKIATLIDRYDSSLTNQFLRLVHELERLQRMRAGQKVPPPLVADLDVHEA